MDDGALTGFFSLFNCPVHLSNTVFHSHMAVHCMYVTVSKTQTGSLERKIHCCSQKYLQKKTSNKWKAGYNPTALAELTVRLCTIHIQYLELMKILKKFGKVKCRISNRKVWANCHVECFITKIQDSLKKYSSDYFWHDTTSHQIIGHFVTKQLFNEEII